MINLTQKETMLLEDQKKHEQMCIDKYTNYANLAQDEQLKQIFLAYAEQEKTHLDTINQILSGQMPNMNTGGQGQNLSQVNMQMNQNTPFNGAMANVADAALCNDMLVMEKYISNTYDTAIFEFTDSNLRQALNHIQKEEQQHGEGIFNYMNSMGMYNPQ